VDPPVRESGDLDGSAGISLAGPAGVVRIAEGCILARRHIHFSPADAARFGVRDGETVEVRVEGPRGGRLGEVSCRVSEAFALEFHVDVDEANAMGLRQGQAVRLEGRGRGEAR